jgi:hypothetical protein
MNPRRWTEREIRVLDAYRSALARGKYRTRTETARDYLRNLERLRRRYPQAAWLKTDRTVSGVRKALYRRGLPRQPLILDPWSAEEHRLLDSFAGKVASGRYPQARLAARDYLQRIADLRKKCPELAWLRVRRSVLAVEGAIRRRSHELGWLYVNLAWSAPESRILNRYAREVLAGRFATTELAARAARREIERLHRLNQTKRWAMARRSRTAIEVRIHRVANSLGRARPSSPWTAEEDRVIERFARALASGRFPDGEHAARECWVKLAQQRVLPPKGNGRLPMASATRALKAVALRLLTRAKAVGWDGHCTRWSPAEMKVTEKWARQLWSTREQRGVLYYRVAGQALQLELKRHGYSRSYVACKESLMKLLRGRKRTTATL